MRALTIISALFALLATPLSSHEFWISPDTYSVETGASITAAFRVGQNFEGSSYAFIEFRSERFDMVTADGNAPVPARMGDTPALNITRDTDGLVVIVHETSTSTLRYTEWEKFVKFVDHKDFAGLYDAHAARNLPQEDFVESYARFAKSLIAVGNGAGTDSFTGLKTEIVAVTNPYTDDLSDGMVVDVIYDGAARPNAQIELFEKTPDGEVTITLHRTDETGRGSFPVKPGHEYLVDAVVIEDTGNNDATAGPVWHTLWASLTFQVPN